MAVFEYWISQNRSHNLRQAPLLTTDEGTPEIQRLANIYKRLNHVHFGQDNRELHVLGFIDKREPVLMGFVSFAGNNLDKINGMNIWKTENVDPFAEHPYSRIGIPCWLRGFNASVCLGSGYGDTSLASVKTKKIVEERCVAAVTAAGIRMLLTGRASCENADEFAVAVYKSPLLHKRHLLLQFHFPLVDLREPTLLSRQTHSIAYGCSLARNTEHRVLLYTNSEDIWNPALTGGLELLNHLRIPVVVVNEQWQNLSAVLDNILSLDGAVILQLTDDLRLGRFLDHEVRHIGNEHGEQLTRDQEREILNQELMWSLPLLYAENHIDEDQYLKTVAHQLECVQCGATDRPCHSTEHLQLQMKQARMLAVTMKDAHAEELTWYDPEEEKVRTMHGERISGNLALLYESIRLAPGPMPYNEFTDFVVPCDQPEKVPVKRQLI